MAMMQNQSAGGVLAAVGGTPLLRLEKIGRPGTATLLAKAEFLNPGGSVKARSALAIVRDALGRGALKPGGRIVEVSTGNEGVALAMVGAVMDLHVTIVMPRGLPKERHWMIEAYGGEVALVDAGATIDVTMRRCEERAAELLARFPDAYMSGQFDNPQNPRAHET